MSTLLLSFVSAQCQECGGHFFDFCDHDECLGLGDCIFQPKFGNFGICRDAIHQNPTEDSKNPTETSHNVEKEDSPHKEQTATQNHIKTEAKTGVEQSSFPLNKILKCSEGFYMFCEPTSADCNWKKIYTCENNNCVPFPCSDIKNHENPKEEPNNQDKEDHKTDVGNGKVAMAGHWPEIPQPPNVEIPLCPTHPETKYHALYDPVNKCHYNHEHFEDPKFVNDVFGPPGAWWATDKYPAQELSYPWQTFMGANENYPHKPDETMTMGAEKMENHLKHEGYGWMARKNMPCKNPNADGCITDFRFESHSLMSVMDAVVRFHSYQFEGRLCLPENPSKCGIVKTGGWVDFGYLYAGSETVNTHLPVDPVGFHNGKRLHNALGVDDNRQKDGTWYGHSGFMEAIGLRQIAWGPINTANPSEPNFFCNDLDKCKTNNGALAEAHLYGVNIPKHLFTVKDGTVSYKGYTDRYGKIKTGCTTTELDCIPFILENVPVRSDKDVTTFQYRDDAVRGTGEFRNFDTAPRDQYWIKYPN